MLPLTTGFEMVRVYDKKHNIIGEGKFNEDYSTVPNAIYTKHEGYDEASPYGSKVKCNINGNVITAVERPDGYGKCLVIQDITDRRLFYLGGHLSQILVKLGQPLKPGDIVAFSGNSGGFRGIAPIHFHLGVYFVESTLIYDKGGLKGLYNSNGFLNQQFAVDPFDHAIKWLGKRK